jgi:hypothetical protein
MDNRAMNHEVARPQNNSRNMDRPQNNGHNMDRPQNQARNMDRPMPHENASNRGSQPHNNMRPASPAPQNRGGAHREQHSERASRGPKGR